MAEGAQPALPPPPPPGVPSPSSKTPLPPPPGASVTGLLGNGVAARRETYIVQFLKEQIYRIPPPENATLVEQYRSTDSKKRRRCSPCLICFAGFVGISLVVVGIVFAVAAGLVFFTKPETPTFAVDRLVVKSSVYNLTVQSKNPSKHTGYAYEGGEEVVLVYKNLIIANGNAPSFDQPKRSAANFALVLRGKGGPPKEIAKDIVPLGLEFGFKAKYKVGNVELFWQKIVNVKCEVKVRGLAHEAKIISQRCSASLR